MARRTPVGTLLTAAVLVLLLATLAAVPCAAWWGKGHMAVALIAQRHMNPALVTTANLAAKVLCLSGPYPLSPDMVQAATWADDIRSFGLETMSSWHFITTPYEPDPNFTLAVSPVTTVNVASVIPLLQSALQNPKATSEILSQSLALLIHFMGDIHQPLHNANLFSSQYPQSDFGGNRQTVIVDSKRTKMLLHAYWDSIAEGPAGSNAPRPLEADAYNDLNVFVDYLEATYASTLTAAETSNTNTTQITMDSFKLAVDYAYPGGDDGATLSDVYKANAKRITERQVLLAGYRLATMLNTTLKGVSTPRLLQGLKNVQDGVPITDNTTVINHYEQKGLSAGATVGIAIALFMVGAIIAAVVVFVFVYCSQRRVHGYHKCEPATPEV